MSLTKQDSPDGCGGTERNLEYEDWLNGLPSESDDDRAAWEAQRNEDKE